MNIIEIVRQGAPIVQSATLLYKSNEVMIVCLDMKSEYCDVAATGDNAVWLVANERSRHLYGDDKGAMTEVRVDPAYNQFIGGRSGRYDITLVFAKEAFYKKEFQEQILDLPKDEE